jgi:hypothetical protein
MACSNPSSLSHSFIDAILDNDRKLHADTLGILDDSAVAKNSFDFRFGCYFAVCT